jgi:hypothetical protein
VFGCVCEENNGEMEVAWVGFICTSTCVYVMQAICHLWNRLIGEMNGTHKQASLGTSSVQWNPVLQRLADINKANHHSLARIRRRIDCPKRRGVVA